MSMQMCIVAKTGAAAVNFPCWAVLSTAKPQPQPCMPRREPAPSHFAAGGRFEMELILERSFCFAIELTHIVAPWRGV
jgi:hypothetical protein